MTLPETEALSVIVERVIPHPPEKIWHALTEPGLLEAWLLPNDFAPVVGRNFTLRGDWGTVDCRVLEIQPARMLSYTWGDDHLSTVVTWTLTPAGTGTRLRMEQTGFQKDQPTRYLHGARAGWPRFLDKLEQLLAGADGGQ